MNEEQLEILFIIEELSGRSVTNSVRDSAVVEVSGLPAEEVDNYLSQLEALGYITVWLNKNKPATAVDRIIIIG
jgi:DNA-binding IclR family transcriptional regulator